MFIYYQVETKYTVVFLHPYTKQKDESVPSPIQSSSRVVRFFLSIQKLLKCMHPTRPENYSHDRGGLQPGHAQAQVPSL